VTWHPGSDSNRQPLVLETSALPVELPGSILVAGADLRLVGVAGSSSSRAYLYGGPPRPSHHANGHRFRASACAFTKRLRIAYRLSNQRPCGGKAKVLNLPAIRMRLASGCLEQMVSRALRLA
jgi:hypothetical protein